MFCVEENRETISTAISVVLCSLKLILYVHILEIVNKNIQDIYLYTHTSMRIGSTHTCMDVCGYMYGYVHMYGCMFCLLNMRVLWQDLRVPIWLNVLSISSSMFLVLSKFLINKPLGVLNLRKLSQKKKKKKNSILTREINPKIW